MAEEDRPIAAHEIALGIVVHRGRVLVQRRRDDPGLPDVWEFPGGKVRPGEARAAAVAREVAEETGLVVAVVELVSAHCHIYDDRRVSLYAYRCALRAGEPGGIPVGAEWIGLDECRLRPMPAANRPIVIALERTMSNDHLSQGT